MDNNEYENQHNLNDDQHGDDLLDSLGKRIEEVNNAKSNTVFPGVIDLLPELLQEMHKKGIPFSIDGSTGNVILDGFYKFGPIVMAMDSDLTFEATDKKNKTIPINSYDDLIKLNFSCWKATMRKNSANYVTPGKPWIDEFYHRNLIKRQFVVIPVDDENESEED